MSMLKHCKRCSAIINCNRENIANCLCNTITISEQTIHFLKQTKYNCLCNSCLQELDKLITEANKENFPIPVHQMKEGLHFYMENSFFVFTEYYHILKGYCCENNCRHCAFGYNLK